MMLDLIPLNVLSIVSANLSNLTDIFRLNRINHQLNSNISAITSNSPFLTARLIRLILQLSDNIEAIIDFEDLNIIDKHLKFDLLKLLHLVENYHPLHTPKIVSLINKLQAVQAPLNSLSNLLYLIIAQINLNPSFSTATSPQMVESGLYWAQGWYDKTKSIDSQFTLAAYWRLTMDLNSTLTTVPANLNDDDIEFADCDLDVAKENYAIFIRNAVKATSTELFTKTQSNDALLKALANPYTRIILNYLNGNSKNLSLDTFLLLDLKKIEQLCSTGSINLLNQYLTEHSQPSIANVNARIVF